MNRATQWDIGSGYDLFASLYVLHHPTLFGLRPAWAAGVRSRFPGGHRDFLEKAFSFLPVPLTWLYGLPMQTKDAAAVLAALANLPAADRLESMLASADVAPQAVPIWHGIYRRGAYTPADLDALREIYQKRTALRPGMLQNMGEAWVNPAEFGEKLLEALRVYCQVFFFEEEERIWPVVRASRSAAEELAGRMSPAELLEELSHGVKFDLENQTLVLVPSFWAGPLVFFSQIAPDQTLVLYGGRPEHQALAPGEDLPGGLVAALKALADPTRLRILRYLAKEPLTLSELARRLRLRLPTIIHHLYALRLAELVQVTFLEEGERRYALRRDALRDTMALLEKFLA